ncbi:UNVERIFIED_CONTAM: F-box protein [Sesamum radiatum]|uniref:F-box protein n=1 Tax=Sesamum radiatum TaxID=300843 RepID=A0AAW2UM94_SESRA
MSICNSAWPSTTHPTVRRAIDAFPSGHRSFYSDSFPAVRCRGPSEKARQVRVPGTSEFISAVDIYCDEKLVYSKVLVTETLSGWFLSSPFRIDLLEPKETVPTPLKYDGEEGACMELAEDRIRVSWILIDPTKKRAVNVASLKAVEARRHWLTEDIQLRYATVMAGDGGAGAVRRGNDLRRERRRGTASERGEHAGRGHGGQNPDGARQFGNFG